jgi:hypothetical protein
MEAHVTSKMDNKKNYCKIAAATGHNNSSYCASPASAHQIFDASASVLPATAFTTVHEYNMDNRTGKIGIVVRRHILLQRKS